MYQINEPTKEIKSWHERWARNRDFVDGEAAVKAKGELYLPKARFDDTLAEYLAHVKRTGFFPAAFKIAQGWLGLIRRKPALLESTSARVVLLAEVATRDGRSLDDVAAWTLRETMITNFTGLLTDHPSRDAYPKDMSAADELRLGFRPDIARYTGENILEVTRGFINGLKTGLVRVRLLENDGNRVRELLINDSGFYEVRIHEREAEGDSWEVVKQSVPFFHGKPQTEIPFDLINTDDSLVPTPSLLQHCVDLNLQHYIYEGALASAIQLTTAPIVIVTGYKPQIDPQSKQEIPLTLDISAGAALVFNQQNEGEGSVNVDWFTYKPEGQELVTNKLRSLKDELSAIGHSILAPEKPAPEAAETQLIRRAAENAMLAAFTELTGKRIEAHFKRWAAVADAKGDLAYKLNLDFLPQPMPAANMTVLSSLVDKRQLSLRTFHEALADGELMPRSFDPETEADRLAEEAIDLPPLRDFAPGEDE